MDALCKDTRNKIVRHLKPPRSDLSAVRELRKGRKEAYSYLRNYWKLLENVWLHGFLISLGLTGSKKQDAAEVISSLARTRTCFRPSVLRYPVRGVELCLRFSDSKGRICMNVTHREEHSASFSRVSGSVMHWAHFLCPGRHLHGVCAATEAR